MKVPIFTIWFTDKDWDAMPFLYEICIASWHVFNPDTKIIIYTNHHLHLTFLDRSVTEIRNIKDYYIEDYNYAINMTNNKAHQSDYVRYSILSKEPGIYLDTDVLLWQDITYCLQEQLTENVSVGFPMEDKNMICNCFITRFGDNVDIFDELLYHYRHNYIKHSYLFNSQKMLNLLTRRYLDNVVTITEPTLFECDWQCNRLQELKQKLSYKLEYGKTCPPNFNGVGTHLYSSIMNEWKAFKQWLNLNCYNKDDNRYIIQLTNFIIDEYIKLIKEVDTNVEK